MSDTPMRENLARILDPIAWSDRYKPDDKAHAQQYALAKLAAVLEAMLEPSGLTIAKGQAKQTGRPSAVPEIWQAMIHHIRDEGKTDG